MNRPVVLAAHGTADRDGLAALERLRRAVGDELVGHEVVLGFVDVVEPHVRVVLRPRPDAVVLPLFVTAGFHVRMDIPATLAEVAPSALLLPHVGSLDGFAGLLARVLAARVGEGRAALVVAGSSDDRARAEADALARAVGILIGIPELPVAHLSGPGRPLDALDPVPDLLVSTLLAPGHFQRRLRTWAQAHGVESTEALCDDGDLVATVVAEVRRVTSGQGAA